MLETGNLQILDLIGRTPVYEFRPHRGGATVMVKLEGNNIGGSVKDRAAWGMLRFAELEGRLTEGTVIVEPTSGNTGIALAMMGAAMNLNVILTMPESMSAERRKVLAAYGAELVLTDAGKGMKGTIEKAESIVAETKGAWMPDQFSNPGNPWAHRVTTGAEILRDLDGRAPFAFVAGVGTGGTLTGVGTVLKASWPEVSVVAVEPSKSPVLSGGQGGPHRIQGIGAGFVPKNLDLSLMDRVLTVDDEAAFETARWFAQRHGLFCGISTGANLWAAMEMAKGAPGEQVIVTVAPDRGDKYLSTGAFDE